MSRSRTPAAAQRTNCRTGAVAALGTLLGFVLSGPLALLAVQAIHPQPPWRSAAVFAESYHPIQILPYLGGWVLIASLVVLVSSAHAVAPEEHRARTGAALALSGAFAALIGLNYVIQSTWLPAQAAVYDQDNAAVMSALSMANPGSLAWGIEMWGWAWFGVASWLVAPVFAGSRLERATARTFVANGVVSVAAAAATVAFPRWPMSGAGLAAFALWNLLLAAMAVLALSAFRRRARRSRKQRVPRPLQEPERADGDQAPGRRGHEPALEPLETP